MLGRGTISQFAINDVDPNQEGGGGGQDPEAVQYAVRDRSGERWSVVDGAVAVAEEGEDIVHYSVRDRSGARWVVISPTDDEEEQ